MRIPRIFQQGILALDQLITLDERASKYLVQVLRFTEGREVILFNGLGGEYKASLIQANRKKVLAKITEFFDIDRETSVNIHLAQCVSKGDRFEFAIQKSVELGIQCITPIFSARSQLKLNNERKNKKLLHWQQIALSACEQSGRTRTITFNEPVLLNDFIAQQSNIKSNKICLHPEGENKFSNLISVNHPKNDDTDNRKALDANHYTLLIGPEGGFDAEELELAKTQGFTTAHLGKLVLRTETAPIACISAIHALENLF